MESFQVVELMQFSHMELLEGFCSAGIDWEPERFTTPLCSHVFFLFDFLENSSTSSFSGCILYISHGIRISMFIAPPPPKKNYGKTYCFVLLIGRGQTKTGNVACMCFFPSNFLWLFSYLETEKKKPIDGASGSYKLNKGENNVPPCLIMIREENRSNFL